jgi:hypothetical protein
MKAMSLLCQHFEKGILRLFHHVLTVSYFSFAVQFYKQTDSVAMGSPLSLVITNFFAGNFKQMALDQAAHKPLSWFCYVDDTFIIWQHRPH